MLSVMLVGSVLIGVITALLNAAGIDDMMAKTLGPATQMAADAVAGAFQYIPHPFENA